MEPHLRKHKAMSLALKSLKVYLKLFAILAAAVVILLTVVMNQENKATIWFLWRSYEQVNVLWLILITAVSSVVSWWAFLKLFGILREFREVRKARRTQFQTEEQQRLARELAEREKRLDEKLRRSISDDK